MLSEALRKLGATANQKFNVLTKTVSLDEKVKEKEYAAKLLQHNLTELKKHRDEYSRLRATVLEIQQSEATQHVRKTWELVLKRKPFTAESKEQTKESKDLIAGLEKNLYLAAIPYKDFYRTVTKLKLCLSTLETYLKNVKDIHHEALADFKSLEREFINYMQSTIDVDGANGKAQVIMVKDLVTECRSHCTQFVTAVVVKIYESQENELSLRKKKFNQLKSIIAAYNQNPLIWRMALEYYKKESRDDTLERIKNDKSLFADYKKFKDDFDLVYQCILDIECFLEETQQIDNIELNPLIAAFRTEFRTFMDSSFTLVNLDRKPSDDKYKVHEVIRSCRGFNDYHVSPVYEALVSAGYDARKSKPAKERIIGDEEKSHDTPSRPMDQLKLHDEGLPVAESVSIRESADKLSKDKELTQDLLYIRISRDMESRAEAELDDDEKYSGYEPPTRSDQPQHSAQIHPFAELLNETVARSAAASEEQELEILRASLLHSEPQSSTSGGDTRYINLAFQASSITPTAANQSEIELKRTSRPLIIASVATKTESAIATKQLTQSDDYKYFALGWSHQMNQSHRHPDLAWETTKKHPTFKAGQAAAADAKITLALGGRAPTCEQAFEQYQSSHSQPARVASRMQQGI